MEILRTKSFVYLAAFNFLPPTFSFIQSRKNSRLKVTAVFGEGNVSSGLSVVSGVHFGHIYPQAAISSGPPLIQAI